MAQKRMVSLKIWRTNRFRKLPDAARLLYVELMLYSDDDGFCDCFDECVDRIDDGEEALRCLIGEGYLIDFGEVVVVRHWRVHNSLRADRLQMMSYPDLAAKLWITTTGSYETEDGEDRMNLRKYRELFAKNRFDPLNEMRSKSSVFSENGCDSQDSIGKVRVVQDSSAERRKGKRRGSAGAGLTAVERQTLEIVFGPGRLDEAIDEVGEVSGSLYEALMAHWKRKTAM